MSFNGDFSTLSNWTSFFETLEADEYRREIMGDCAVETLKMIDEGFNNEQDPMGEKWAPKKRPDGMKILEGKTKDLRHSFKVEEISKDDFKIQNSVPYFVYHQRGATRPGTTWQLPKRQMMIKGKLPPLYQERYIGITRRKWEEKKRQILGG